MSIVIIHISSVELFVVLDSSKLMILEESDCATIDLHTVVLVVSLLFIVLLMVSVVILISFIIHHKKRKKVKKSFGMSVRGE